MKPPQTILSLLLLVALFAAVSSTFANRSVATAATSTCAAKCLTVPRKQVAQCLQEMCVVARAPQTASKRTTKRAKRQKALTKALNQVDPVVAPHSSLSESSSSSSSCYPMSYSNLEWFKQCDDRWKNEQLGTSNTTICKSQETGSLVTSLAMAMNGLGWATTKLVESSTWGYREVKGENITPLVLNKLFKSKDGYYKGDVFKGWRSVGMVLYKEMRYGGEYTDQKLIAEQVCSPSQIVLLNLKSSGRWVLATGATSDKTSFNIKDPGSTKTLAPVSDVARAAVWSHLRPPFGDLSGLFLVGR